MTKRKNKKIKKGLKCICEIRPNIFYHQKKCPMIEKGYMIIPAIELDDDMISRKGTDLTSLSSVFGEWEITKIIKLESLKNLYAFKLEYEIEHKWLADPQKFYDQCKS